MNLDDYIHGARYGREAHDLEAEAMRDPLLGDALDGFDAVQGDHFAALERLAGSIRTSAVSGRAAARSQAVRFRERRIRSWSIAAASVFLVGAIGGGVWLIGEETSSDTNRDTVAAVTDRGSREEVEMILPPVTVIEDEGEATDTSDLRLNREEVRDFSEVVAEPAGLAVFAADTTTTAVFRRYVHERNIVRSAILGHVTLSFEVGANGRPENITVVSAPANFPEAAETAVELLKEGPDWPAEPARKLVTINL